MIELNADIGEGCDDASLMPYLARVSIACGGHTGDVVSMAAALRLAAEHGVAVGAHPSYPDRAGFGRRALAASGDDVAAWVTQQTETLAGQASRGRPPTAMLRGARTRRQGNVLCPRA